LAERLPEILAATQNCGEVHILPIAARIDRAANRVLVRVRTNSSAGAKLLPPMIVHRGEQHTQDGKFFTPLAQSVLNDGGALLF